MPPALKQPYRFSCLTCNRTVETKEKSWSKRAKFCSVSCAGKSRVRERAGGWRGGIYLNDIPAYKREKERERSLRFRDNPRYRAMIRHAARKGHLKKAYGVSLEQFDLMLSKQGGVCPICKTILQLEGGRLSKPHIDHDHKTKAIREILCASCNWGLGYFKDNAELLIAAAEYIRRHREG